MEADENIRKCVETVDIHRLPQSLQRAANNFNNTIAEVYGLERPEHLKLQGLCSHCQTNCSNECECWCHGTD